MSQFEKPYLVQRLIKPYRSEVTNAFSFGAGLKNAGLSEDALKLMRNICDFDYMGSAEFEWGAVPAALKLLVTGKLVTGVLEKTQKPVYYICDKGIETDVKQWIKDEVAGKGRHTKERVQLAEAIRGDKYADTLGWLALEEFPFMCFIDKEMWEKTCTLFGIKTKEKA